VTRYGQIFEQIKMDGWTDDEKVLPASKSFLR